MGTCRHMFQLIASNWNISKNAILYISMPIFCFLFLRDKQKWLNIDR